MPSTCCLFPEDVRDIQLDMSATVVAESLPGVDTLKRTRKTHHKVRTGCITCKYVGKSRNIHGRNIDRCLGSGERSATRRSPSVAAVLVLVESVTDMPINLLRTPRLHPRRHHPLTSN